ncbi:23S rRNA pseudouridine1911/1915/1917 synthase [Granulicatella balaenopterae]|uniref:Pseudouridine synthase n=1 Tax=Granulicatella balaenopterae TaxID=137733 RepID=A0A1H9MM03_9LACT|nr:RluA family pseudouridine synthase [Granulicatella balaenopterae]SER24730.1 23S rRNA pseudouridine1911/1915/1917 synthase [Granulicatella balaenopterae]
MNVTWSYAGETPVMVRTFLRDKGISKGLLAQIKRDGKIFCNGQFVIAIDYVYYGDIVTIVIPPEGEHETTIPSYIPIDVVYEDDFYLVVNKPAGVVSIPSKQNPDLSMANRVKGYYMSQGYEDCITHIVTRLDKDTTGVMLFAKLRISHAWMDHHLHSGDLQKTYVAITKKSMLLTDHGEINAPIARSEDSIITRCVHDSGKKALTEYWLEQELMDSQVVDIRLHTGRTHQIRVHFSYMKAPLIGDDLYGGPVIEPLARQALHCRKLAFTHPVTNKKVVIEAPLPEDMQAFIQQNKK